MQLKPSRLEVSTTNNKQNQETITTNTNKKQEEQDATNNTVEQEKRKIRTNKEQQTSQETNKKTGPSTSYKITSPPSARVAAMSAKQQQNCNTPLNFLETPLKIS